MLNNYLKMSCTMIFGSLLLFACSKDIKDSRATSNQQSNTKLDNNGNSIRLTHTESEFGILDYAYNEDGLVDRLDADYYGGYFKHEYNSSGTLITARFYSLADVLQFRIDFFYQHNDVV